MATRDHVSLVLEGFPSDGGDVRIGDFVNELQLMLSLLRRSEAKVTDGTLGTIDYRVVGLSHSSPATVEIQARPMDPQADYSASVVTDLFRSLAKVRDRVAGDDPPEEAFLQDLRRMTDPVGKTVASVRIRDGSEDFELDRGFRSQVLKWLGPDELFPGSFKGMLEAINVHNSANRFNLYPDFGPSRIACQFASELEAQAIASIGKFVEARGVLRYKRHAPFPYAMQVDAIEAMPDESSLPSFWELKGAAPEATGDLSSESFVRGLREAQ